MKVLLKQPIIYVLILAVVIRIINLGNFPKGFHVDEVKIGWNSLSLINTFKDDKLKLLPLYYNTFGDFRPTGIFYLSIPATLLFGNTVFAVRFTSAFFGGLSILAIYLLSKKVFKDKGVANWVSFVLAISPWHIAVSRASSEVLISSFFIITSIYFYLEYLKSKSNKHLFITIVSIVLSYFLYHSARILLPVYLIITYLLSKKGRLLPVFIAIFATLILSIGKDARQRFSQVSIFKSPDVSYELQRSKEPKVIVYGRNIIEEYGKYFSSDFLIGESAKPYRYLTLGVGLLNYIDLVFLIIGVYLLFKNKENKLPLYLLLVSPLPAILTIEDSPNLHRSFYMVLFIAMIEGYAIYNIKFKKIITEILIIGFLYFVYAYFLKSDVRIPYQKNLYIESPTYRNLGNIELAKLLEDEKGNYDKIYVSNYPDNLYPWYAFFNKKDPEIFNNESYKEGSNERQYQNIIFTDVRCPSDTQFSNNHDSKILVVDYYDCNSVIKIKDGMKAKIINEIKRPNNATVYYLLTNK